MTSAGRVRNRRPKGEKGWPAFSRRLGTNWDIPVPGCLRTVANDRSVTVTDGHWFTLRYTFRFLISWIYGILDSMKRITVDLPDDLYKRVRRAAYTEDTSVSEVIRRLVTTLPEVPAEDAQ